MIRSKMALAAVIVTGLILLLTVLSYFGAEQAVEETAGVLESSEVEGIDADIITGLAKLFIGFAIFFQIITLVLLVFAYLKNSVKFAVAGLIVGAIPSFFAYSVFSFILFIVVTSIAISKIKKCRLENELNDGDTQNSAIYN